MTTKRIRHIGIVVLILALLVSTTVLAAPYGSRRLYTGSFGGDVVELQRRLATLGYDPGVPDGIFGARTREAIIKFQRAYGLVPDGQAGKWTFRAVDRAFTWKNGSSVTVVSGDSLWKIAQRTATTVEQISWLNQLQDTMLYPGQVLRVPGTAGDVATPVSPPVVSLPPTLPTPAPAPAPAPAPGTAIQPVTDLAPAPGYTVLGYYAEDWQGDTRSLTSLQTADGKVNLVVNFQLLVDSQGNLTTRDYTALMAEAQAKGLKVQGLVHNYVGNRFDASLATAVLSDPAIRTKLEDNLVAVAREKALSGINIDIENVPPDQRANYTTFVQELSGKLHAQQLTLSLSVPAKTVESTTSPWSGAFDYKALGQYADKVVPMAYDEHTIGYSAGPVASVGWVDRVAAYTVSQVPKEKVLLGIPAYGYDWKTGTTSGTGLSAPGAVSLAQQYSAPIQWDDVAKVPYFSYTKEGVDHTVYFENARSLAPKLEIVKKYGLDGIAIWRLGTEDPGIWSVIAENLK